MQVRAASRWITASVFGLSAMLAWLVFSLAPSALSYAQAAAEPQRDGAAQAQAVQAQAAEEAQIESVLEAQVAAWNRGDILGFMHGYDASPDTTFVGTEVEHGYDAILERYQRKFSTRAQMGTLRFSDLETRLLSGTVATTTGRFELTFSPIPDSSAPAPPPKSGIFSLVWVKRAAGWRIVLDHTS
jgi:ketosteroid isomerase-like protein